MIQVSHITAEEEDILEHHYRRSSTPLIRERAHTLLLSKQGRSAPDIALILRRNENTVRSWLHAFEEMRIASMFPRYAENTNASKLSKEQREEIKEALRKPPSDYGIPKEFWTITTLKEYVHA